MPNCFQLISKVTDEPERFALIDDDICTTLGVTPDPKYYYLGWYNCVGLAAACGKSFADMRQMFSADMLPIIDYLDAHYTIECWAER